MTPTTTAQLTPTTTALLLATGSDRTSAAALLEGLGYRPVPVSGADAVTELRDPVALCLIDLRENGEALRVVRAVRQRYPSACVIGIADPARPTAAADAIRAGAFDVLPRPPATRDLEALLANAREQAALATASAAHPPRTPELASYGLVGSSAAMRSVMELVQRAAPGRCGILVCGERGTGREMIARAIAAHGPHTHAAFVKVDCSAMSPDDVEAQLFGRPGRRGAGAFEARGLEHLSGRSSLVEARDGVLFLEHITELSPRAQQRLERVLRDRDVYVDDETSPVSVDVRPMAAVDGTIEAALEDGRLRHELYERLALVRIDLPSLRQRREDVPALATHFLKELCRANGSPIKTLTRPALTLLAALPWRGNAPELRGLLERLILLVPHGLIKLEDVLAHTQLEASMSPTGANATLRQARAKFERDYIAGVLQHQHGRIAEAARVLGIQRTNLYRKIRRLNLTRGKSGGRGSDVS